MERSEIVYRMAANARKSCPPQQGEHSEAEPARALVQRICAAMRVDIMPAPPDGVMLGGAYARLQMWSPTHPEWGGMIWVSKELPSERAAFAIAHEIGHLTLHPGESAAFHPSCDQSAVNESADPADLRAEEHRVEEYTPRARRELEANAFAAELLAPRARVRALFARDDSISVTGLAAHFGISETLARRRLADTVLAPAQLSTTETLPAETASEAQETAQAALLLGRLDERQRAAARTVGPALVVAGPGTGKTATLVGRVAHLVSERGVPPERVLALTFSNRAAGEMRERLASSGLHGERMPVMTIHAFAATLLREYAPRVPRAPGERPLKPDFRILDEADAFLLMEELLGELPLRHYRSYGNPTRHLGTLRNDFSRACDGLHTPEHYLTLVEAMPLMEEQETGSDAAIDSTRHKSSRGAKRERVPGTYTAEEIARARERAHAYAIWDAALRQRGLVDFGGLILRAVELLRHDTAVLAEVRARYPEVLVDEFQDTNAAAAELLMLLAGATGSGLWVVGDRNQAIYRWRGAAPTNLRRLAERYPHLAVHTLRRCYRSVPAIVDLGTAIAARMAELATRTAAHESDTSDDGPAPSDALRTVLAPVTLEHVRPPLTAARPAVLRCEAFTDAPTERLGLAATIRSLRAAGVAYGEQAVLCRTHKQTERIAQALAESGLPVSLSGDYFEREEVKDALALLALAAGPDTRGLLRAGPLITALGFSAPPRRELVSAIARLKARGRPLPGPLAESAVLAGIAGLAPETRTALRALGAAAVELRYSPTIAPRLLDFLLRPRGYAWRLVRLGTPDAQRSLAALGELLRLAQRFDTRWMREDDFRRRLSRAVYRFRRLGEPLGDSLPASLVHPDSLENVPAADVVSPGAEDDGASAPPELGDDEARPVRCFLHYLAAIQATDAVIALPASDEDAVRVLTLHASKGLEFPVVYLPGLAQGQFPRTGGGREDPSPPGFREDDAPGEREAEERCLFYVGVTRARDTVVLTRAARYEQRGTAKPSILLGLLDSAPPYLDAPSPLSNADLAALQAVAASRVPAQDVEEDADEDGGDEDISAGNGPVAIPDAVARAKPVFPLHELRQYLLCPRQYKYASIYELTDPAEDAVYRFHRYVRRGRGELARLRAENPRAGWDTASACLRNAWAEVGPAGHAYEGYYWQSADTILRDEWRALADPARAVEVGAPAADALRAELHGCIVEVHPERVSLPADSGGEGGCAAPTAPTAPAVLVRQHIGRESQEHRQDLALPLLYIAYQQAHPQVPVRIKLAYLGNVLADATSPASGGADAAFPQTVLDVTDEARKKAELYLKPGRRSASALDKLDRAALGIRAGLFPPAPRGDACTTCPYRLICPADPADPGEDPS